MLGQVYPLLRMTVLLHKRIQLDVLKGVKDPPTSMIPLLDSLPPRSHALLLSTEELTAALYSPQDSSSIRSALVSLVADVNQLAAVLYDGQLLALKDADINALTKQMAAASINSSSAKSKTSSDSRKWFDTCFEQINKVSQTTLSSIDIESKNS